MEFVSIVSFLPLSVSSSLSSLIDGGGGIVTRENGLTIEGGSRPPFAVVIHSKQSFFLFEMKRK